MQLHRPHGPPIVCRTGGRAWIALVAAILLPGLAAACARQSQQRVPAIEAELAITHVAVIDVESGDVLANRTVLVAGGRIVAVGASDSLAVPAGARRVEAAGQYVVPGLWDTHVHSATSTVWHFPLFIAHGVTSVRNMHTGVDTALELTHGIKRRLASGELLGPRVLANGPIVDGEPAIHAGSVVVRTAAEARAAVDSLASAGADFIKVYDRVPREAFFALAEQAKQRGIAVDGHVPNSVRPEEAAGAGLRTEEHLTGMQFGCSTHADSVRAELERGKTRRPATYLEGYSAYLRLERALYDTRDPALCVATAEAYRRNGVAAVPTFVGSHHESSPAAVLADSASMRWIPAAVRRRWEDMAGPGPADAIRELIGQTLHLRDDNVRVLSSAGVTILAGTDVGNMFLVPGLSLHQELALLVQAGLSPLQALQAATVNPARQLQMADSLGTVAAGQLADLVLLRANPLVDIRNTLAIAGVVVDGRFFGREELDALLSDEGGG